MAGEAPLRTFPLPILSGEASAKEAGSKRRWDWLFRVGLCPLPLSDLSKAEGGDRKK